MPGYPTLTAKTEINGPRHTNTVVSVLSANKYCNIKIRVVVGDDDIVHVYFDIIGGPVELIIDKDTLSKLVADRLEGEAKNE